MRGKATAVLFLLLFTASNLHAGGAVMAEFQDIRSRTPEELPHVLLKAVVAEFLDPMDSGLGKSLGYLLWRETLTAISDQVDAGVIIAEAPPGERLVDMLQQDYHLAAERIAKHQHARIVLWGAVEPEDDEVSIETYLSILDQGGDSKLRLTLSANVEAGPPSWHRSGKTPLIDAVVSRNRFNFSPISVSRRTLFERPLVTTSVISIYQKPDSNSHRLLRLPAGRAIQALDMDGAWFKVQLADGKNGYLHAGTFGNLQLPPRKIVADRKNVNLRSGPGTDHRIVANRNLRGEFLVLDMRYRTGKGLWYRINTGDQETWIAAFLVKPQFSVPIVHFLAGLYRYYGQRPKDCVDEFGQFLRESTANEDHINIAAANQLLGTCRLLNRESPDLGYAAFSKAISYTPYDPNAYLLRSVVSLGAGHPEYAIEDLETALMLDPKHAPSRHLTATVATIARESKMRSSMGALTRLPGYAPQTDALLQKYNIKPDGLRQESSRD